jgi:hypothetical protein
MIFEDITKEPEAVARLKPGWPRRCEWWRLPIFMSVTGQVIPMRRKCCQPRNPFGQAAYDWICRLFCRPPFRLIDGDPNVPPITTSKHYDDSMPQQWSYAPPFAVIKLSKWRWAADVTHSRASRVILACLGSCYCRFNEDGFRFYVSNGYSERIFPSTTDGLRWAERMGHISNFFNGQWCCWF